jgi:hypothetical protein
MGDGLGAVLPQGLPTQGIPSESLTSTMVDHRSRHSPVANRATPRQRSGPGNNPQPRPKSQGSANRRGD